MITSVVFFVVSCCVALCVAFFLGTLTGGRWMREDFDARKNPTLDALKSPVVGWWGCLDCRLLYNKAGEYRAISHGHCPRCAPKAMSKAMEEVRQMKTTVPDSRVWEEPK